MHFRETSFGVAGNDGCAGRISCCAAFVASRRETARRLVIPDFPESTDRRFSSVCRITSLLRLWKLIVLITKQLQFLFYLFDGYDKGLELKS